MIRDSMLMSRSGKIIVVRKKYDEKTYRDFLHDAFSIERNRDRRGREAYYWQVMHSLVENYSSQIVLDSGEDYLFSPPIMDDRCRMISAYIKKDALKRNPEPFLRMIDAFMQLKVPGFNSAFTQHLSMDATGLNMGEFLRDPNAALSRPQLALNAQSIIGLYKYKDVDTFQGFRGGNRYVAFLAGENIDYLLMIDLQFDTELDLSSGQDQRYRIVYGFCIPGEEFSPVIMRSLTKHNRQIGILYTSGNLIDMAGGHFEEMVFEIFTTDKDHQGSKSKNRTIGKDPNMAKAFELHYGPKLRRHISKVSKPQEFRKVSDKIDKIRLGLLL